MVFPRSVYFLLALIMFTPSVFSESARDPQKLFENFCFSCHGTGWEDAPVVGDSYAWEERKEQGIDVLFKHTLEGFNSMPAKGGCSDCTTDELQALIVWMTE